MYDLLCCLDVENRTLIEVLVDHQATLVLLKFVAGLVPHGLYISDAVLLIVRLGRLLLFLRPLRWRSTGSINEPHHVFRQLPPTIFFHRLATVAAVPPFKSMPRHELRPIHAQPHFTYQGGLQCLHGLLSIPWRGSDRPNITFCLFEKRLVRHGRTLRFLANSTLSLRVGILVLLWCTDRI